MKKQIRYIIKKHPDSTENPWLMEGLRKHDEMCRYRAMADPILCPEDLISFKTFHTAEEAREYIKKDQKKVKDDQICYSDSVVCRLEITFDSVKIIAVDD